MRIAGFAVAQQTQRAFFLIEQGKTGRFAYAEPAARGIKWAANIRRNKLQRIKSVQGGQAQAIDAADHRCINESKTDEALRKTERFCAR